MKDSASDLARLDALGRAQSDRVRRVGALDRRHGGAAAIERHAALGATDGLGGVGGIAILALVGAAVGAGIASWLDLPIGVSLIAGAAMALLCGVALFFATMGRRQAAARSRRLAAEDEYNAERARQIEAARASGQFDHFGRD